MKRLLSLVFSLAFCFSASFALAQNAPPPAQPPVLRPPAVQPPGAAPPVSQPLPTEVDFDRQGAPARGIDSDSLLTDLFSEEGAAGTATPVGGAAPAPAGAPAPAPGAESQTLYNPPGVQSPVANPAGQGEAVIERSGQGAPAPAQTPGQTPKRRARRSAAPAFRNSAEARWHYASKAWITPNKAASLGCGDSYSPYYALYHLRCLGTLKSFGD